MESVFKQDQESWNDQKNLLMKNAKEMIKDFSKVFEEFYRSQGKRKWSVIMGAFHIVCKKMSQVDWAQKVNIDL